MTGCYMAKGRHALLNHARENSTVSEIDLSKSDKRTIERYIRQGVVEEKAWEKHLKALPDLAEKGERVQAEADEYILDEDLNEGAA
jgi:hypothetical protein